MSAAPTTRSTHYISAINRLRALPPVLGIAEIQLLCDRSTHAAHLTAIRWRERGLLVPFGRGVYFNLIADPTGPATRVAEAFRRLFRRPAVIIGGTALQSGGWTTQIYKRYDVALAASRYVRSAPTLESDYVVSLRPTAWYNVLHAACEHDEERLATVPPEYALADMLLAPALLSQTLAVRNKVPVVPPDELDMDEVTPEDNEKVIGAMLALGATRAIADELMEPYLYRFRDSRGVTWL